MLVAICLLTAGVFALDVAMSLGHVIWLLYALPLWLSVRLTSPAAPLRYASLCTLLLGTAVWVAPPGIELTTAVMNRTLGVKREWFALFC